MNWNTDDGIDEADEKRLLGDCLHMRDEARRMVAECDRKILELEEVIARIDPEWLAEHLRRRLDAEGRADPRDIIVRLRRRLEKAPAA